ncbi:MAG TPA: hypothetical protein VK217_05845 [Acidimicrobiales bacterium]|nr:hypothetical protein [Acidimicrobiales bacterium]
MTGCLYLEAGQARYMNDSAHNYNVALVVENFTTNGSGVGVRNRAHGDGIYVVTTGSGYGINVWQGDPTHSGASQAGVHVAVCGRGQGILVQDKSGAGPQPLIEVVRSEPGEAMWVRAGDNGTALRITGKVAFSRSGISTIPAGHRSVKVRLDGVSRSSMIHATLQSDAGSIAVANAVSYDGSFTVNLTAAPSRSVEIAWFVID